MRTRRSTVQAITYAEAKNAADQAASAWTSHKAHCYPCHSASSEHPTWCAEGWSLVRALREAAQNRCLAATTDPVGSQTLW